MWRFSQRTTADPIALDEGPPCRSPITMGQVTNFGRRMIGPGHRNWTRRRRISSAEWVMDFGQPGLVPLCGAMVGRVWVRELKFPRKWNHRQPIEVVNGLPRPRVPLARVGSFRHRPACSATASPPECPRGSHWQCANSARVLIEIFRSDAVAAGSGFTREGNIALEDLTRIFILGPLLSTV